MLTFYPEFEASVQDSEFMFLLDLSNSMSGDGLRDAKKVLLLCLHHLPHNSLFNIVVFGSGFDDLFPCPKINTKLNLSIAEKFIQGLEANKGSTIALRPLQSFFLLNCCTQNVFLLSDGHLSSTDALFRAAKTHSSHTRIFTMGVR